MINEGMLPRGPQVTSPDLHDLSRKSHAMLNCKDYIVYTFELISSSGSAGAVLTPNCNVSYPFSAAYTTSAHD